MQRTRPKVSLLMLAAEWFGKVGIANQKKGRYSRLPQLIQGDARKVIGALEKNMRLSIQV